MGVYIEGLDRPRNEYMRIHIDFDGEVWVFKGSGWKSLGIKATNLDLVRCRECKYRDPEDKRCDCGMGERQGCIFPVADDYFCKYGERRADENAWETLKAMKESEAEAKEIVKDYIVATYGSIDNL